MKKVFTIRLTEEENEILEKLAKKQKTTKSKIIKNLILKRANDKRMQNIEKLFVINSEIYLALSRVTGNINQIAYHLNSGNFIADSKSFFETAEELKQIAKEFMKFCKENQEKIQEVI